MTLRLANMDDLPQLKLVYQKLIDHMNRNKIEIWDEIYPCEFFHEDIEHHRLYLLTEKDNIIAAFSMCEACSNEMSVKWENEQAKALYLDRFGVNVEYLRKGVGSIALKKAIALAKEKGAEYLRLFVVDINEPARKLYVKNGFQQAEGMYDEVIDDALTLHEYGYEIETV